jgi:ATP adenylyltransferase/5',5'''-P-1,P-4-tetraphosphate phosphorylase II
MNISEQARKLIKDQQNEWTLAGKNYTGLKNVKIRTLHFDGFDLLVQFNPERIRSSAAKVDTKSIEARPCFLCQNNLPQEQRGIPVLEKYLILVNPFPIFPEHLTIPHQKHIDQRIEHKFMDMLELSVALEDFTVFYNGPKCGASAPDHFHFQAGIKGFLPIEEEYKKNSGITGGAKLIQDWKSIDGVEICSWSNYLRKMLTFRSKDKDQLVSRFEILFTALKKLQPTASEPMLNILSSWEGGYWTVHIFPRQLHRPWQFFEDGEKQILFSPASVDMGGVLITPRAVDFSKITEMDIRDIFEQICLDEKKFESLLKKIMI